MENNKCKLNVLTITDKVCIIYWVETGNCKKYDDKKTLNISPNILFNNENMKIVRIIPN